MKCWARWSTSWNQGCLEKYKKCQICRWHHPYGRKKRRIKEPLDESESEKVGLKLNIHKTKIMASSPISSWQIVEETVETVADFSFLGSTITADGYCTHEIKRHLLLGSKAMTNLDSILKSRDIILPTKVHLVKAMVFPVVMNGCENWTIKKAECQRIDAVQLWCWRRLLRVPWTARRSNQSILNQSWVFIGRTDAEAGISMFWTSDVKNWLLGKDPDAGKDEGGRRRGWQRMRWLDVITDSKDMSLCLFVCFSFIFISWRLITLQYCSDFCHTLTWISHGFTCIPHPNPPSHLPLHLIPLGLPSAPGLSTCLMHPTWAGDLFHPR